MFEEEYSLGRNNRNNRRGSKNKKGYILLLLFLLFVGVILATFLPIFIKPAPIPPPPGPPTGTPVSTPVGAPVATPVAAPVAAPVVPPVAPPLDDGCLSSDQYTCSSLGSAQTYGVLASSTITNTGVTTVNGDMGLSPGSSITGFPPGINNGNTHQTDACAAQAQLDATNGFLCESNGSCNATISADMGGTTLGPGIYCSGSSLGITGTLTLNGTAGGVWIFRAGSTLTVAGTVLMTGGGLPCNVWWQVGSSATIGGGSTMVGNIIASSAVTFVTGATHTGRAFALNAAVTMDTNTITPCNCTVSIC